MVSVVAAILLGIRSIYNSQDGASAPYYVGVATMTTRQNKAKTRR